MHAGPLALRLLSSHLLLCLTLLSSVSLKKLVPIEDKLEDKHGELQYCYF